MKLVLIRHGATAWSISGQHTGRTDLALLPEGIAQSNRAITNVRSVLGTDWDSATIISSPLQRAHTTAEIIFGANRVCTDDNLMEMHYGDYEGLTSPEIRATRPDWDLWRDGNPNGETTEQGRGNIGDALADEFLVGVVTRARHAVGDHGRQQ